MPGTRSGPGLGTGPAEASGDEGQPQDTPPSAQDRDLAHVSELLRLYVHGRCREDCAHACSSWSWVTCRRDDAPVRWRIAWAIHGLPRPLARKHYKAMLAAVEAAYGAETVVAGLRTAASMPAVHGSGIRTDELDALADKYERAARRAS